MSSATALAAEQNTLTDDEKAAGWKLLFDGTSLDGWQPIGKAGAPVRGWTVESGILHHGKGAGGGDIVTVEQFENFEFSFEWRIAPGANGGVKYNLPDPQKGLGCEYQLLDDEKHPDAAANGRKRHTASLYDVLEPSAEKKVNAPGEWNQARIIVRGNSVEHWLNGARVLAFEFGSDSLKAAIASSKFKSSPGWGVKTKSPLLLQDHSDEVSFRNLKVRKF
jgi:hypothetical protein